MGRARPLCPGTSDINLFRYRERVIDLNAEVANRTFDLGVTEQELHRPQIAGAPMDQGRLRAPQRMRPKQRRVEPDAADPVGNETGVLACRHATSALPA